MAHRIHEGMLEPLGVSLEEERIYLFLLEHPRASYREIIEVTGIPSSRARAALAMLESKAIVSRGVGGSRAFVASPPSVALESLVSRRMGEIEQAKANAEAVMERVHETPSRSAADLFDVITGEDAVRHSTLQMLLDAGQEVLELSRPPYPMSTQEVELANLAKGVRYRYIYARSALDVPGKFDEILTDVAAGEKARLLPDVPLKLSVVDRKIARVFLSSDEPDIEAGVLTVRAGSIVDALVVLFESLWDRAVPLSSTLTQDTAPAPDLLGERDRRLLALLSSGLKDEAIARHLGITTRTLRRRMVDLMDALDARSRFQAGAQAALRGWIPSP